MMDFKQALHLVCKDENLAGQMCNPFALRCFLEDKCNWSLEEKSKIKEFFAVDKKYGVFCRLYKKGKSEADALVAEFESQQNDMSKKRFVSLIETILFVMQANTKQMQKPAVKQQAKVPRAVQKKPQQKQGQAKVQQQGKVQQPARVQQPAIKQPAKVQQPAPAKKRTPTYVVAKPQRPKKQKKSAKISYLEAEEFLFDAVAIYIKYYPLLACLFALVTWVFGISIPWLAWQWIIGVGVVAILLFVMCLMADSYLLDGEGGIAYFLIVTIPNVILLCIFGLAYKVIFLCTMAQMAFALVIFAVMAFDDCEPGYGTFFVLSALASIGAFVGVLLLV